MKPPSPRGYGRIVRSGGRNVRAIVEEKLCTPAQRKISEVSSGILCFSRSALLKHLDKLSDKNAQKEYLLTDMVTILSRQRKRVVAFPVAEAREVLGVNDRLELAHMERILRLQKAEALMREGVTIVDPNTTYIDAGVEVGNDTVIEPGVSLLGNTRIGCGCTVRVHSTIEDSILGDRVQVRPNTYVTGCEIGSDVILGPFARLRDGAVIDPGARIGNLLRSRSRMWDGVQRPGT